VFKRIPATLTTTYEIDNASLLNMIYGLLTVLINHKTIYAFEFLRIMALTDRNRRHPDFNELGHNIFDISAIQ